MRLLLFISRVAIICNICYLVTVIARYFNIDQLPNYIVSSVVVLGFIAIFLNIVVNLIWLVSLFFAKKFIPVTIGVINFIFLIFQLLNTFYLEI